MREVNYHFGFESAKTAKTNELVICGCIEVLFLTNQHKKFNYYCTDFRFLSTLLSEIK